MSVSRDYGKFLKEDGSLNVRLLPRPVYTKLVTDYRQRESAIEEVFEELYLTWDIDNKLKEMQGAGEPTDKSAAAQAVLDELDDGDWWRVMAAFERGMARDFPQLANEWADLLDPIYDDQEAQGWVEQQ